MISRLNFKIPPRLNFKNIKETKNYGEYKFYLWWLSNKSRLHTTIRRTEAVIKSLNLKPGSKVLDEGCGWGYSTLLLSKNGCESIGIDIEGQHLRIAKEIVEHNNIKAHFVMADVKNTPFRDKEFDAIIQMETLEHIGDDWEVSIKEIARILKDDGELVISTPNPKGLAQITKSWIANFKFSKRLNIGDKDRCISPLALESKLNEYNLKIERKKLMLLVVPFVPNFLFSLNLFFEFVVEKIPILRRTATTYILYCRKK